MPKISYLLMSMPGNIRSALSFKETNKQTQDSHGGIKDFVVVNLKIIQLSSRPMTIQLEKKQAGRKRRKGREKVQ